MLAQLTCPAWGVLRFLDLDLERDPWRDERDVWRVELRPRDLLREGLDCADVRRVSRSLVSAF